MKTPPQGPALALDMCPAIETIGIGRMPVPGTREWMTRDYWAMHLYCYEATLAVNGVPVPLRPGMIGLTPPHSSLVWSGPESPSEHLYCLFRVPERRTGSVRAGERGRAEEFTFPYAMDAGADFARLWADALVAMHAVPHAKLRANVRIWDILWSFRDLAAREDRTSLRAEVKEACRLIDLEIHTPLRIAAIASRVGVSHNHLTRMFQAGVGQTVVGYIRRRRVERARSLLEHTDFPVGTIASMVGIPDLHLFNKTLRRETGYAPTALRRRARSSA